MQPLVTVMNKAPRSRHTPSGRVGPLGPERGPAPPAMAADPPTSGRVSYESLSDLVSAIKGG